MIDLKKEREAFESMNPSEMLKAIEYKVDSDSYQPKEPILSLSVLQNAVELNYGWLRWKKRAELAQAEITELKQKLEKLESGEFILVPKNSKTVVAIENMVCQQVEASGIDEPIHRLDVWRILDAIEEAMIEAVEKDDE